jgi:hypothetical protein
MSNYLMISLPGGGELLILAVVIAFLVFWVAAIIDIARSNFDSSTTKVVWMLVVIFLGVIGAAIYHFAGKPTRIRNY